MLNNSVHRVPAKTKIFKEGEESKKLYLVKQGEVLCVKNHKDRLVPIFRAKEGDILGESAMTPHGHYTYSAISLGYAELTEVSASQFAEIFKESPDWLVNLTKTMIHRFENTANLVAENRLSHATIASEEEFSPPLESEFKKILG